jgi:uncharacterized protein (UPF0264 family)
MQNRKLLVSVQSPQEAREALLGGARIVDSEDPKTALGNIAPEQIMDIAHAVLSSKRDLEVQLSTNIGEDQLLFRRSATGQAIVKSDAEMAGKAAQASLGVASAMGTLVHPSNIVKVGVDGMTADEARTVISTVVSSLRRSDEFWNSRVMAVFFVHDIPTWNKRKENKAVVDALVAAGEFFPADSGFMLKDHVSQLPEPKRADALKRVPSRFQLNDPFSHSRLLGGREDAHLKSDKEVIGAMVDCAASAGAHGIMLDTSILMKVANICIFDTAVRAKDIGPVDVNRYVFSDDLHQSGILSIDDLRFFVAYSHFKGIEANIAGSIASHHAQQLWALIPELDQLSARGAASGVVQNPLGNANQGSDTRLARVIRHALVQGIAPPEQGGVLNVPRDRLVQKAREADEAFAAIHALVNSVLPPGAAPVDMRDVDRFGAVVTRGKQEKA